MILSRTEAREDFDLKCTTLDVQWDHVSSLVQKINFICNKRSIASLQPQDIKRFLSAVNLLYRCCENVGGENSYVGTGISIHFHQFELQMRRVASTMVKLLDSTR
jgi:hypothetical protein